MFGVHAQVFRSSSSMAGPSAPVLLHNTIFFYSWASLYTVVLSAVLISQLGLMFLFMVGPPLLSFALMYYHSHRCSCGLQCAYQSRVASRLSRSSGTFIVVLHGILLKGMRLRQFCYTAYRVLGSSPNTTAGASTYAFAPTLPTNAYSHVNSTSITPGNVVVR